MRIFADADFPFMSWRRYAYVGAAVFVVLGIGGMVYNAVSTGSWLNYGVDFSGGTLVQVDFEGDVQVEELRAVDPTWQISSFGEVNESAFVIRIPGFEESLEASPADLVEGSLAAAFGEGTFQIVRMEAVGPRVGDELQLRALYAILISMVLTLVYLAFRFEWRFGVAALVTTAHDVVISLGVLALLQMEISVSTVAAFLTIVGYSLNDTIVVFDRIRENLANRKKSVSYEQLIDRAINETLPRTVLTSITTLTTLGALYLFGGAVIRDFALVLIIGVAVGTLSTMFIASPALAAIEAKWPREQKRTRSGSGSVRKRETASV
jgi:preprotein translocase subunit SecF